MSVSCNTVVFVGGDGKEYRFPLDFLIERGAIIADKVNGEDIMSVMGGANQLWIPGVPAKYFVRDIREIRFTEEEEPPIIGPFVDDGKDYTNLPNVSARASYNGCVGEPLHAEGWAYDFGKAIAGIQFSLDGGLHWTEYGVENASGDRWVKWEFDFEVKEEGDYSMLVRSVNEEGECSPVAAQHSFVVSGEGGMKS